MKKKIRNYIAVFAGLTTLFVFLTGIRSLNQLIDFFTRFLFLAKEKISESPYYFLVGVVMVFFICFVYAVIKGILTNKDYFLYLNTKNYESSPFYEDIFMYFGMCLFFLLISTMYIFADNLK